MRLLFLTLAALLFSAPVYAQSMLHINLADDRVDISTGFDGTRVILFGTTGDPAADIIVTLKGPEHTVAVRRKGRVMGAWVNTKTVEFRRVPSYYDYASTMDNAALSSNIPALKTHEVGMENLGLYPEDADEDVEIVESFRDALVTGMQKKGFYPLAVHGVQILNPGFFKTVFELPPGVPTGYYKVEALLMKDDAVIAKETRTLQVGQVGFNARIYLFAQDYSLFYGIFAVLMALSIGWSAFTFLRRD